jgi:amino acid adenylation domain-containing protein
MSGQTPRAQEKEAGTYIVVLINTELTDLILAEIESSLPWPTADPTQDSSGRRFRPEALVGLTSQDRELFNRFGFGPVEEPAHRLIHRAFEARVTEQPGAVAIEHEGRTITYDRLNRRANALARQLADLGVGPGDAVAVFLRRSIPMVIGQLAALKLGAAYVPQHVGVAPDSQLQHVAAAAKAKAVVTLPELVDDLPPFDQATVIAVDHEDDGVGADWPTDDDVTLRLDPTTSPYDPRRDVDPDSTAFVLFTSGTTGKPNGVQVTHRNVCNVLLTEPANLGMGPGLKVAQILSIAFDMAAWETLGAIMNGAELLIRGRDIQATVERADIVIATPSILGSVDAERCGNVSVVAVAGEPCPRPLADTWGAFTRFHNSCGPTETTIVNTVHHYRPGVDDLTIGSPTPNNTVYVLDENRRPCPIGEVGEMWAGGDCVTAGYLDNAKLTDERYAPDPFLGGDRRMFRTRDLGRWTADGRLEHFGRTDDQVKVRGFRVELDSVAAAIETVDGCTKAVALKLDDRNLVAFAQPSTVDPEQAKQAVADALPYYCVPADVVVVDELPRTDRGKVDKRDLRQRLDTELMEVAR